MLVHNEHNIPCFLQVYFYVSSPNTGNEEIAFTFIIIENAEGISDVELLRLQYMAIIGGGWPTR